MNLAGAFDASANRQPDKIALFWGEQEFSYSRLQSQTARVSGLLAREFGTQPGERIGVWLKNCPEFIPALFAILRLGAVVVPINNFLKPDEVNYILSDAEITTLITDNELAQYHPQLVVANPTLKLLNVEQLGGSSRREAEPSDTDFTKTPPPHIGERDPAVIIYTSGTTGRPKGAVLSHSNLLHNVESCRIVLQTVQTDRLVVLLPMFHSYMLTVGLLLPLLIGGSIVLVKSLHPVRNALQEILLRQATILPAIPQFYRSLVQSPITSLQPLRLCISGAAPLPAQILKEFEAKFHLPLIEGYGLSEASPVVTKNPLDGKRKPGSIGLPIPNVEVSIQDETGRLLAPTAIGEVCVRGGNVMQGYWKRPEETAKVMRQGWLLTGDIGYRDAEGYFYITDRKKDMLLVNGLNVYPREIEEVLYRYPGVKEAAVIGKPDARRGEQPVAFVSANEGAALDEKVLQQFIRTHVADYKVPRKIVVLPALPRNATGKILKTSLRQIPID